MEELPNILVVDDDPNILTVLRRHLETLYFVDTAADGEKGLARVREHGPYHVVISDYTMPGMNGVTFLNQVHQLSPDTVLVMLTGFADLEIAVSALHEGHIFRFLNKPCNRNDLLKTVADCREQYRIITAERVLTAKLNRANSELQELNHVLEQKVSERTETLRRLFEFVSTLNGLNTLDGIGAHVVRTAAEMLNSTTAVLLLSEYEGASRLIPLAAVGNTVTQKVAEVPAANPLAARLLKEEGGLAVNTAEEAEELETGSKWAKDLGVWRFPFVCVPLPVPGGSVGLLWVTESSRSFYSVGAVSGLKTIAKSAATALLNRQHQVQRDAARDSVIFSLAKLSESRDADTGGHLLRLQVYCRLLCEGLAEQPRYKDVVTPEFIADVVRSSPLHDIGKVGIPDHILKKPGKLTSAEFDLMKSHARIGGDTLNSVFAQYGNQGFIRTGMDIAYHHHEWWDGTGYPDGLAGEKIPLSARILAVADVYDAMTTVRVYKPAHPHETVRDTIVSESGTHFDPAVVEAFLSREAAFRDTLLGRNAGGGAPRKREKA